MRNIIAIRNEQQLHAKSERRIVTDRNPKSELLSGCTKIRLILPLMALTECLLGQVVSFSGLGGLPGSKYSYVKELSGDGRTVIANAQGWNENQGFFSQAVFWNPREGMVPILPVTAQIPQIDLEDVSYDGSVIVGTEVDAPVPGVINLQAIRWTRIGGAQRIGDLPGGLNQSQALGVSGDGATVVGVGYGVNGGVGLKWTQTNGIDAVAGQSLMHISADSSIMASVSFRVINGAVSSFPHGIIRAMSADGNVVAGVRTVQGILGEQSYQTAFRWSESGGVETLLMPPGALYQPSIVYDVSRNGSVAVGSFVMNERNNAFYWNESIGVAESLEALLQRSGININGWQLQIAFGVSDDGSVIAGVGRNPEGQTEGWIVHMNLESAPPKLHVFKNSEGSVFIILKTQFGFYYDLQSSVDLVGWNSAARSLPGTGDEVVIPLAVERKAAFVRAVQSVQPHADLQPAQNFPPIIVR